MILNKPRNGQIIAPQMVGGDRFHIGKCRRRRVRASSAECVAARSGLK